jgi:hypothetical protein
MQANCNLQKDNFHNLILTIDKMLTLGMLGSTISIKFLFPKGVLHGERVYEMQPLWWRYGLRKDLL